MNFYILKRLAFVGSNFRTSLLAHIQLFQGWFGGLKPCVIQTGGCEGENDDGEQCAERFVHCGPYFCEAWKFVLRGQSFRVGA